MLIFRKKTKILEFLANPIYKGDPFTYEDFTPEQIEDLQRPALEAAALAEQKAGEAEQAIEDIQEAEAALGTQLIDGATPQGNTLKKLEDRLRVAEAIIGDAAGDDDTLINTVRELLAVFSSFPEGSDMATLLSAKINVTDIYNALDCVIEGKVLDARQGKVLSDALTSLQAAVTSLSSSKADKTYTDTELAKKVDKIEGKGLSTDDYISTKKLSDTASSGTIAVATKTVKTLSTTLTNAHTVVISPTVPADLTQEQEATLILKTGATVPAISFATAGVTFVWMNQPEPTAYIINKTYTFLFFWESATVCQVFYAVKS